ncbi:MAG: TolC family protein [Chitinivibrionia bacterium]|nr:TolC family protein [Chitinivibrionia bacterium]MCL1947411.1 TolC family protein [Chitinivibrionia bacterium]
MRKEILTTIALIAIAAPVFSDREMSRNDVLKYAFENSDGLAQLKAEREKIEFMRKEYYGKAFPDINAAINYLRAPDLNEKPETPPTFHNVLLEAQKSPENTDGAAPSFYDMTLAGMLDGAMAGLADKLGAMNAKNTFQWEISATQPIFVQGKVKTGLKIAGIALKTLDEQYKGAQFDLAQKIIDAYNGALLAQQNAVIQQDALVIAEESHRLALAKFQSGNGSALDTLNTKFAYQQAVLRLSEANMGKRLALKSLANAASLDNETIILRDSLTVPEFNMSEDSAWEEMQKNNSSLRLLSQAKILQAEQTHLLKTDYLPLIAAFANIGQVNLFNKGSQFSDNWTWRSQIGVGIQIPIWNGGQRQNKLHQAKLDEFKLDKQEIEAKNGLRLALSAGFENLSVARQELIQVEQMLVLAEQGFKISKLSFELGQLTQLELNNNEQNFRMAKLAFNNAVFKINSAVVNIEKLVGNEKLISVTN